MNYIRVFLLNMYIVLFTGLRPATDIDPNMP